MPKYKGGSVSTHFFWTFCFYIGLGVLTLLLLGLFEVYDREGPGFNPFTRMPNGRLGIEDLASKTWHRRPGISEYFVSSVGCIVLLAALWLLRWLVSEARS